MAMTFATDIYAPAYNDLKLFYGTSDTGAGTATKIVACPKFTSTQLVAGAVVIVKFDTTNAYTPVADVELNVNSTGRYRVRKISNGSVSAISAADELIAGIPLIFGFDGTYWVLLGGNYVGQTDYTDNDTLNTAGSTNKTGNKMYLIAAQTQGANPQTYSNSNDYIGTDNCLYSNGKKVLYGEYSESTEPSSPKAGMIWLKKSTKSSTEDAIPLIVSFQASSLPVTISDSSVADVTSDMSVIKSMLSNPNVQQGNLTVDTSDGSLTVSGTITGTTTITLWLTHTR